MLRFPVYIAALLLPAFCWGKEGNYGKLDLILPGETRLLWDYLEFHSPDTTFSIWNPLYENRSTIGSIPYGKYTMRLCSVFDDTLSQEVSIPENKNVTFPIKEFYQKDKEAGIFLDRMSERDTLRIYYYEQGCFHSHTGGCFIIKSGGEYILCGNDSTAPWKYTFKKEEVRDIKNLEQEVRKKGRLPGYSTTSTYYYFEMNRRLIQKRLYGGCYFYAIFYREHHPEDIHK